MNQFIIAQIEGRVGGGGCELSCDCDGGLRSSAGALIPLMQLGALALRRRLRGRSERSRD